MVLLANNSLIVHEFRTGYVLQDSEQSWGDRMHILINVSSCGTLIGQAWTKTAFGVTLLRISNRWQQAVLWFCIATMNIWMVLKVVFQWARVCDKDSYDNWYRLDFCIGWRFRDDFKEGGNGELQHLIKSSMLGVINHSQSTTSSWTLCLRHFRGSYSDDLRCAESKRSASPSQ